MNWTSIKVEESFSGRLIGSAKMRRSVVEATMKLPESMIESVVKNIWFISSPDDAWAMTFRAADLEGQDLIVLSDDLLNQSDEQIHHTIIHEIGHVMLGHRNSIGFMQSYKEVELQEEEANSFAKTLLSS